MEIDDMENIVKSNDSFTKSWRYKIGLALIIIGHVSLLLGLLLPLLSATLGTKETLLSTMIIGGELISLVSIVFLGKDGFAAIKNKIFGFFKSGYVASVGRVRHYIGIILFCTNILTTYTVAIYAWFAFSAITKRNPLPIVWNLNIKQQSTMVFWLFFLGEITFIISIYVLGADWWERLRNIIIWKKS